MKKLIVLLLCMACILSATACSSGGKEDDKNEIDSLVDFIQDATDNAMANQGNDVEAPVDPKTVDYSKIDYELGYDDGAKMPEFMNDMQAGKYDNKVIKITGIMSKGMMDPTTNNVMLYVGEGSKQGFSWRIVDANDSTTYPLDDDKIELVGVMLSEYIADWGMYGHYLYVLPENVKDLGTPE
ncbi:MAG: hypothetical protein K6G45_00290 [Lachnospiraceae bacterium]|nr:hypothetical protein [Lachnospiraceae bacterium]